MTKKIIAIQFKYLGDAVFIIPALRTIGINYPTCELHVLVPEEASPIFEQLPFLKKIWSMPRTRGKARIFESWHVIKLLRCEKFDIAIDFVGNDRGAIVSFLSGARERLGVLDPAGHRIRNGLYTHGVQTTELPDSWIQHYLAVLSGYKNFLKKSPCLEMYANPCLSDKAKQILSDKKIICHITTSQPKKEWCLSHWAQFYQLANSAGHSLIFSTGTCTREKNLLAQLKILVPEITVLPPITDLRLFIAILKQAQLVIAGDTGPLHFALALGVPVIGLFGTQNSIRHVADIYGLNAMIGGPCHCDLNHQHDAICHHANPCLSTISPEHVFQKMHFILNRQG